MKRREFITLLGGATAATWPLSAFAQDGRKPYRVGLLSDSPAVYADAIEAFRRGLRELGWIEGQNIIVEYRWAEGRPERMREFALNVDIIVVPSSIYTEATKRATLTIPIIFMSHAEPIKSGHVISLARPGGNITGMASMMSETSVKVLELLTEAIPGISRVAVIWDPATPSHEPGRNAVETAGAALKLQLQTLGVRAASEYAAAFAAINRNRADAVLILATPMYLAGASRLAQLAIVHKLPSIVTTREYAEAGCLLSYGPDRVDMFRRAATYVDKILKGAKPADLPVEQPTKFELVINLKTAKGTHGSTCPARPRRRGDRMKRREFIGFVKTHHRFERMRLRGLSGARDEFHVAAIVQNLKTLALPLIRPPPEHACA